MGEKYKFPHALYNKLKILVSSAFPGDCEVMHRMDARCKKTGMPEHSRLLHSEMLVLDRAHHIHRFHRGNRDNWRSLLGKRFRLAFER